MTTDATTLVAPHMPWLSQGDIFKVLPIVHTGIRDSVVTAALEPGPAMLISHACAIDKKNKKGRSTLEYLSFLPIQDVSLANKSVADVLRADPLTFGPPYNGMYLGEIPDVGEGYVPLVQPYTLPSLLLRTELQTFTGEETGEGDDIRVVATMHNTRVCTLTEAALRLFWRKWSTQWTRLDPLPDG